MQEPNRLYDVWFDAMGERALLIAETVAPAFDPDRQRAAIDDTAASVRGNQWPGPHASDRQRAGILFGADGVTYTGRGADARRIATVGMIAAAGDCVSPCGQGLLSALPLAQRGRGRTAGRQCAVRRRPRHHARVRVHVDRRGAGLSDASAEPRAARSPAAAGRARTVADAGHRRRQHLHRVCNFPVFRRRRAGAAGVLHGCRHWRPPD